MFLLDDCVNRTLHKSGPCGSAGKRKTFLKKKTLKVAFETQQMSKKVLPLEETKIELFEIAAKIKVVTRGGLNIFARGNFQFICKKKKYCIIFVSLHNCVPFGLDYSQKKSNCISLRLKPKMFKKIKQFRRV